MTYVASDKRVIYIKISIVLLPLHTRKGEYLLEFLFGTTTHFCGEMRIWMSLGKIDLSITMTNTSTVYVDVYTFVMVKGRRFLHADSKDSDYAQADLCLNWAQLIWSGSLSCIEAIRNVFIAFLPFLAYFKIMCSRKRPGFTACGIVI